MRRNLASAGSSFSVALGHDRAGAVGRVARPVDVGLRRGRLGLHALRGVVGHAATSRRSGSVRRPRGADATALVFIRLLGFGHLVVGALDAGRWHLCAAGAGRSSGAVGASADDGGVPLSSAPCARMRENRFFSAVVASRTIAGIASSTAAPTALVRHPGYAGMIVGIPASGLALGSWLGVAFAAGYAALIAPAGVVRGSLPAARPRRVRRLRATSAPSRSSPAW